MEEKEKRRLKLEGAKLLLYVKELEQALMTLQHASLWDRNPYLHSARAKRHIKALEDEIGECVDVLLSYTGALASCGLCAKKELHAYFFIYDFLFQFHDDILRQEYAHRLLIRDVELTARFHEFFRYSVSVK